MPTPAPSKRKTKASVAAAKDTESMNIKESFGMGKANPAAASDDEENHVDESDLPGSQKNAREEDHSMDVS